MHWLVLCAVLLSFNLTAEPVRLLVEKSIHISYTKFLNGRDPLSITDYSGPFSRRGVVELVLLQQALHLGGLKTNFVFDYGPNYGRIIKQVRVGANVMAANSAWYSELVGYPDELFISDAVIKDGEFEAGFYTLSTNLKALSVKEVSDFSTMSAVSNKQWTADWETLSELKLKNLYNVVKWKSMVGMVIGGRADFLLAPFQVTPDLSFISRDTVFVPIPHIKLGLRGSRHFVLSRRHPDAERVKQALEKGLTEMLAQGTFRRAYTEAGFFNPKVKDWKKLN